MSNAIDGLSAIVPRIRAAEAKAGRRAGSVTLVAVSKTFGQADIKPLLDAGHRVFGENRVQEAAAKWPELRKDRPDIELHLIGPLQSNKAAQAVALFDVIETLDREKIAAALASEVRRQAKTPVFLVQVNTGAEPQKAGVSPNDTAGFVRLCREKYGLDVVGLMCIPPQDEDPALHFALLADLARQCGLETLSMGMSADFEAAIGAGATHVRIGSALFGKR